MEALDGRFAASIGRWLRPNGETLGLELVMLLTGSPSI
jgi:hypothetical protein